MYRMNWNSHYFGFNLVSYPITMWALLVDLAWTWMVDTISVTSSSNLDKLKFIKVLNKTKIAYILNTHILVDCATFASSSFVLNNPNILMLAIVFVNLIWCCLHVFWNISFELSKSHVPKRVQLQKKPCGIEKDPKKTLERP